jgi:hypothetical protein
MTHYIRELEDELATLIDSLGPVDGMSKTKEWYAWRDRLMSFVVKKVYESYRNGREGVPDTGEVGNKEAPAGHGSDRQGSQGQYTPHGGAVNSQRPATGTARAASSSSPRSSLSPVKSPTRSWL